MKICLSFTVLFILTIAPILGAAQAQPECEIDRRVVFAGLDWDSNAFHVEVARFIIETGFGCETDVIPGSSLPMLAALGRGDVDITMEVWRDNILEAWTQWEQRGRVKILGVNYSDAVQGWFVPRYVVEGDTKRNITAVAPQLRSVEQLNRYKNLFQDPEQPSKGRFYNCILGWTCEPQNTKKLTAYNLNKSFTNFRPGTGAALDAAITSAYERGEPILFYYWGPTWLLGKFDLLMLEEPSYNEKIWQHFLASDFPSQTTAFPPTTVYIGANKKFEVDAPQIAAFLSKYKSSSKITSDALAFVRTQPGMTMQDAAKHFLKSHRNLWLDWVPDEVGARTLAALEKPSALRSKPFLNIEPSVNQFVRWLVKHHERSFGKVAEPILKIILGVESVLLRLPWWAFAILMATAAFLLTKGWSLPLLTSFCLSLIQGLGFWELSMQTLALMLISILFSTVVGVPVGVLLSRMPHLRSAFLPVLDALQTMPSFVYLIPALMLFGLGKVPAVFATVIYAMPPLIRLTDHGIRNVDASVIEAARAFGASRWQILFQVQIPLALKTIMAGINQTTMLGLSMVVVASMIGARGLGEQVLLAIQKLNVGRGLAAGIGIVALAIVLDRFTQAVGKKVGHES